MKLRVRDNSIRLRLTQSEVDLVRDDGAVRGRVTFGGDSYFDYLLQSSPEIASTMANMSGNVLTVGVPESEIVRWANSNEVSIAAEQSLDGADRLSILIEKDFACLAPRAGEDESDMFPHPQAGTENC